MNFRDLRELLTPEDIDRILDSYGVKPYRKLPGFTVFPTCCHNLIGGSPKLYYYYNTRLFTCYTDCHANFDIFELIIKMEGLRGNKIGKLQAIRRTGIKITSDDEDELASEAIMEDISHLYQINSTTTADTENLKLEPIDAGFLDERFCFDVQGLKPWVNEGIELNTMLRYKITYDPIDNCIIVPQFDDKGNVVGVRGRYLDYGYNDSHDAKYKPIIYNGKLLNHPKNKTLYGYYQNKEAIRKTKTCIIFEGEKSVLKLDTIYDKMNISVAICGQSISREQIQLLVDLGVSNVVLALDADYQTDEEVNKKFKEYKDIAEPLLTYFNVSIIMDPEFRLGYKDSPIDKGIELFNILMKERVILR